MVLLCTSSCTNPYARFDDYSGYFTNVKLPIDGQWEDVFTIKRGIMYKSKGPVIVYCLGISEFSCSYKSGFPVSYARNLATVIDIKKIGTGRYSCKVFVSNQQIGRADYVPGEIISDPKNNIIKIIRLASDLGARNEIDYVHTSLDDPLSYQTDNPN